MEFEGKRVLVTGGANGLGKAIVEKFVKGGAIVFALDCQADALAQLAQEFPSVVPIKVDLRDWEASRKAVEAILPLNHLVNNAGIFKYGEVLDCSLETLELTFDVNFKAAFNLTQVFAKGVVEHKLEGGTIVNTSSVGDRITMTGLLPYGCSKAALTMLTRCSANDLAKHNIRVNSVRPAGMRTNIYKDVMEDSPMAATATALTARTPLKKELRVTDVANLVVFLSSENSSMITGEDVAIDGGLGVV